MMVVKVVIGWLLLVAGIIALSGRMWDQEKEIGAQSRAVERTMAGRGTDENAALMQQSLQPCWQSMTGFLQARTPEERSQFVRKPLDTIGRMSRYYAINPAASVATEGLTVISSHVLHIGDERAVSMVWKAADGRTFDSVFFLEKGEWKLDWEEFVRYGDFPWALFLSGDGQEVGEFRLLARERMARDRRNTDEIGIVCYMPNFGAPGETGPPSPEFLMSRGSDAGRMLVAAFHDLEEKKRPFGDPTPTGDPEDMIRVRVVARREKTPEGDRFILEKVVVCHWISTNDPGVTLAPSIQIEPTQ